MGIGAHPCKSSSWEAEAGRPSVQSQPGLHRSPYLKNK
jgi:hypothetical protein